MKVRDILNETFNEELLRRQIERMSEKLLDMAQTTSNASEVLMVLDDFLLNKFGVGFDDYVIDDFDMATLETFIVDEFEPYCENLLRMCNSLGCTFNDLIPVATLYRTEDEPMTVVDFDASLNYFHLALRIDQAAIDTLENWIHEELNSRWYNGEFPPEDKKSVSKFVKLAKKTLNPVFISWGIEYDNNITLFQRK